MIVLGSSIVTGRSARRCEGLRAYRCCSQQGVSRVAAEGLAAVRACMAHLRLLRPVRGLLTARVSVDRSGLVGVSRLETSHKLTHPVLGFNSSQASTGFCGETTAGTKQTEAWSRVFGLALVHVAACRRYGHGVRGKKWDRGKTSQSTHHTLVTRAANRPAKMEKRMFESEWVLCGRCVGDVMRGSRCPEKAAFCSKKKGHRFSHATRLSSWRTAVAV